MFAAGVVAILSYAAWWYSWVRAARVTSQILGDAIAERLGLSVKSVVVRCLPSWFHPNHLTLHVRVNGEPHQAAHDLLCDLCIAVARRQGGEIVDKRAPKGAA